MAKSYYGYVERDVKNYTDWSEVSKTISDSLDKEAVERAKIKEDLDKQLDTDLTNLANAPQSEHAGLVEQTAAYTDGATTLMYGLDRDFKAGKVKYSDYVARTNNLRNDTAIVYSKQKELDAQYKEIQERAKSVDGGMSQGAYQEQWQAAQLQSYLDPANTSLMIDPNTFRVNVAKKKINPTTGVVEYGDYQPVSSLYTRLNQKVNNFSMDKLKNDMGGLGQVIESIRLRGNDYRSGQILSIEDVLQRKEGKDALDNYVDAQMSPDNKSSILTNWIRVNPKTGKAFDFTQDPEEAAKDPNKILLVLDPENLSSGKLIAKPTKEQDALVKEWLTQQAKAQLKHVEKSDIYTEQTPSDYVRGKGAEGSAKDKEDVAAANMAGLFYYGNGSDINTASEYFVGIDKSRAKPLGITEITRDSNGVVIHYGPNKSDAIRFNNTDGTRKSQADVIRSLAAITGISDINKALKNGSYISGKAFNKNSNGGAKTEIAETGKSKYIKYVDNIITPNIVQGYESDAVSTLAPLLSKFGIQAETSGWGNNITLTKRVKNKEGKEVEISTEVGLNTKDSPTKTQESLNQIKQFLLNNAPSDATLEILKGQGVFGGTSAEASNSSMGNSANTLNNLIGK